MPDSYYLKARLMPAALTSISVAYVVSDFIQPALSSALATSITYLPTTLTAVLITGIVFLLVQINRVVSKEVVQRFYFRDEERMPSTEYMLWSNTHYEEGVKAELHDRIHTSFGMRPLSKHEEAKDSTRARKVITMCVSQIRNGLRDNRQLLQHNIEYGFMRNLLGGCFCAALVALGAFIYCKWIGEVSLQFRYLVLVVLYILPLFLSRFIIKRYGHYYAKVLFEQFLSRKAHP
ncbi:MAG: hypothetical protein M3R08_01055 [Bacteroidota bacterium]|nr:hypothetical protein [Bacteroidota bacterium]